MLFSMNERCKGHTRTVSEKLTSIRKTKFYNFLNIPNSTRILWIDDVIQENDEVSNINKKQTLKQQKKIQ